MNIKTVVVEDDPLAGKRIENLLKQDPEIEIAACCRDGEAAVAAISMQKPDLVFLDIQLPKMDGFDVLKAIDPAHLPQIIFATAFDQYALKAFDHHAIDFLLKPYDDRRFYQALTAAKERLARTGSDTVSPRIQTLLAYLNKEDAFLKRILIKTDKRIRIIPVEDIQWFEADGYNIKIFDKTESFKQRITMKELEQKLDPKIFLRIHRSYIINMEYIKEIQEWFKGDYLVIMKSGKKLTISKSYYGKVIDRLRQ
jgi:two-component system, LytTR family, response regulator